MELFYWVGMRTNVGKMVSMVCQPCHLIGGHYTEAYGLSLMGEGLTHQESLQHWAQCPEYDAELVVESLVTLWSAE